MTKEIELTRGYLTVVDDEDFPEVNRHKWFAIGCSQRYIYAARFSGSGKNHRLIALHRYILHCQDGSIDVHHLNGNTLDNRRENLLACTRKEHLILHAHAKPGQKQPRHTRRKVTQSFGFIGISWHQRDKRWTAYVHSPTKKIWVGSYLDPFDAAKARDQVALSIYGDRAWLNFPEQ